MTLRSIVGKLWTWYHFVRLRVFKHTAYIASSAHSHRLVVLRLRGDVITFTDITVSHIEFEAVVDAILNEEWKSVTFTVHNPSNDTYRGGPHLWQLDAWAKCQLQWKTRRMKRDYVLKKILVDTSIVSG